MLILTRGIGESVKIGSNIKNTVMVIYEKKIIVRVQDKNTKINLHLNRATPITDDIKITLTGIDKNQVKLGIEAPVEMRIERENNQVFNQKLKY